VKKSWVAKHFWVEVFVDKSKKGLLYDWRSYHLHLGEDVDEENGLWTEKYILSVIIIKMLNVANTRQGVKLSGHLGGRGQRLFLCMKTEGI